MKAVTGYVIVLVTYESLGATIDIFDVKSIAHTFVLAELIRGKVNDSESLERICKMMFHNDVVPTSCLSVMRKAVELVDSFTRSNISIPKSQRENMHVLLFSQR